MLSPNQISGAILEYFIRRLFLSCGFMRVRTDNIYTYTHGALFMIHGKGAAHDADVLMEPPIQLPFSIPTRLLFECKNYSNRKLGLPIIRNALGLRNDINDFEIVTQQTLLDRRNNRRATLAVEQRDRYWIQVGVAAVNDFTKPAIEFAINNKIPLISLSWYLLPSTIRKINSLGEENLTNYSDSELISILNALKDKKYEVDHQSHLRACEALQKDGILGEILSVGNFIQNLKLIGLLQTGTLIFFTPSVDKERLSKVLSTGNMGLQAELYYKVREHSRWTLKIYPPSNSDLSAELEFNLPDELMDYWESKGRTNKEALGLKTSFFSRFTLFHDQMETQAPFSIVSLNYDWLENIKKKDRK